MRQTVAQGSFLAAIALLFGATALHYPLGTLHHLGPGLFPLVISTLLLLLSGAILIQSRNRAVGTAEFRWRNIGLLLLALGGFVLATRLAAMAAGIFALVFLAGFAARKPSVMRSTILSLVLVMVAFAFERLLGLRLRVF